jgi:hypothetical protein
VRIGSNDGGLSAAPDARTKDTFVISLDTKTIAVLPASGVSLLRVTPLGDVDYTVVELWRPGLNCHNSYAVISVRQRAAKVSPVFGQCTKLHSVSHLKGGLQIELQPAAQNVLAEDNALEVYWFLNGKIERLPRPGSRPSLRRSAAALTVRCNARLLPRGDARGERIGRGRHVRACSADVSAGRERRRS